MKTNWGFEASFDFIIALVLLQCLIVSTFNWQKPIFVHVLVVWFLYFFFLLIRIEGLRPFSTEEARKEFRSKLKFDV